MEKILIIIIISVVAAFLCTLVWTFIRVVRFWIAVDYIQKLQKRLFENETIAKKYESCTCSIEIEGYPKRYFDNFGCAVEFLEMYGEKMLEECQNLIDLIGECDIEEGEKILLNAVNQANMWIWENDYIKENNQK